MARFAAFVSEADRPVKPHALEVLYRFSICYLVRGGVGFAPGQLLRYVLQSAKQCITILPKEVLTMKDSTVSARVETNIKIEAEDILQKLGIPSSVVINSLYRQIIYHRGIPFSLTVPAEPETMDNMSKDRLNAKLSHSYAQSVAGEGRPMNDVFDDLERSLK